MLTWAAVDGSAIALLLAIASFVVIDRPLIGVLALGAAVLLFSVFLFASRGEEVATERPVAPAEQGLPVHKATGMYRWWVFRERADQEIARAKRQGRILAILLIEPGDLINAPTDEAKAAAAAVLRTSLRDGDYPAQLDDNRFVVMLPETDVEGARSAANRLLTTLRVGQQAAKPWRAALVSYPKHGNTPDELLDKARMVLQPGRLASSMRTG